LEEPPFRRAKKCSLPRRRKDSNQFNVIYTVDPLMSMGKSAYFFGDFTHDSGFFPVSPGLNGRSSSTGRSNRISDWKNITKSHNHNEIIFLGMDY